MKKCWKSRGRLDWHVVVVLDGMIRRLLPMTMAVLVATLTSLSVFAQDEDVPLSLYPKDTGLVEDVDTRSFQVYRFPVGFTIRGLDENQWGLRIYVPISLGTTKIEGVGDLDEFLADVQSIALVPGVEFLVPVGDHWLLRPFAEVGVGDDSASGDTHLLYSAGIRARGEFQPRPFNVMFGGAFRYRNTTTSVAVKNWYSTVELGADAQLPLGFSLGSKAAHGGVYAILRHFTDLEFEILTQGPVDINWNYEVGLSFSTDPAVKLWVIKLPWIAVGYRFGDRLHGLRLNFTFPF